MSYTDIPTDLANFIIVLAVSLLIGLSQRKHFAGMESNTSLGTDRTYSLIAIFGYVLYVIQPETMAPYICGGMVIALLIILFYSFKLYKQGQTGMTSMLIPLLSYTLAPLLYRTHLWVVIMLVASILILNEMKAAFKQFSQKMSEKEFLNLAKFLLISGVILPVLPNDPIIPGISLTPYSIWLMTVIISGFSYISYLLKHYFFKKSGIIVTGLLGGLYSSMATTVILTKKAASARKEDIGQYVTGEFCCISSLYLKHIILLSVFNLNLLAKYWFLFIIMFAIGMSVAFYFYRRYLAQPQDEAESGEAAALETEKEDKNPLEFQIAILFACLLVVFTLVTHFTIMYFGTNGLNTLSVLVGVSDITPFVLNLYQCKYEIADSVLICAAFQAIISSNIVKMLYGIALSKKRIMRQLLAGFGVMTISNIVLLVLIRHFA